MPTTPWQNAQTYAGLGVTPDPINGPGGLVGPVNGPGSTHTVFPAGPATVNPGGPNIPAPSPGHSASPFDSDPGYAAALAAQQLGISSTNANLNNLVAQRIAAYGDPSLAAQAGFGLDPQAAAFARQNYLAGNAELARIDKSHSAARQAIINRLAGHGLLFSGDTGYQTGQEDQQYGNNVYDAQQRVLADILGYRTNALGQQQQYGQTVQQALEQAWQNYIQHPELYGTGETPPATTPTAPPTVKPLAAPKLAAAAPKKAAVVRQLVNPYTTGQKRRG